jgi:hypothetical protein
MVKLKNEVKGFIYDTCYGEVKKVFNTSLTKQEIKTIEKVMSDDDMLVIESDDLNVLFDFETEDQLKNDTESLNEVLEWCEQ